MTKSTRILHFSESSETGGAETVFLELLRRLDPVHFESVALLMKEGWLHDQLSSLGVRPMLLKSNRSYDVPMLFKLRSMLRHLGIDLVHAHLPDSNAYASLAALGTGVPVIATYHGLLRPSQEASHGETLKLKAVRYGATRVVAVSDALKLQLGREARIPESRLRRIYNGVDWNEFDRSAEGPSVRTELGLGPQDQVVGMAANLKPEKGYPYFLRAAARIAARLPRTRFLIAGEGEANVKAALVAEATRLGVRDRVTFLGYRSDLPAVLRAFDVFVLSSLSEGMSIATVEAMGAGLPVVVTRSGGPQELVAEGVTGMLVPPADPDALAERVIQVLQDAEWARGLGSRARASARDRFSMKSMLSQYEALYEECLEQRAVNR